MCSRFTRVSSEEALVEAFYTEHAGFSIYPRYNIAPTDEAEVIVKENGKRIIKQMHFGLIPHWAKDPKMGLHCLNARSETVAEKPAFRDALRKRRCLVVADGFYEWNRAGKKKIPFLFRNSDRRPFAFAGLYDTWKAPSGNDMKTFTIITTEANALLAAIHDRMPVILDKKDYDTWLSPDINDPKILLPLLKPAPPEPMTSDEVSTYVSNAVNKGPECIEPVR
jgi:putative SOS response-associated peptidase YedK